MTGVQTCGLPIYGIGLLKKKDLHFPRTADEVALMKRFKMLLDPHGIMNPGKIFDV